MPPKTAEARREYNQQYHAANRETLRARKRAYNRAHPEQVAKYGRKYYQANRERICERQRAYRATHPEKIKCATKTHGRGYSLKYSFGLSLQQYNAILISQGGVCAICCKAETRKQRGKIVALAVDHCHGTGKIRGLLCAQCNIAIGLLNDNVDMLHKAIKYLTRDEP